MLGHIIEWQCGQLRHFLLATRQVRRCPTPSALPSGDFQFSGEQCTTIRLLCLKQALSSCLPAAGPTCYQKGKWEDEELSLLQSFKTKRKKKKLLQKYCLAPFAINRIYSVTKVRLVSIHHPLLPFVNRKAVRDLLTLLGWRSLQAQVSCPHSFLNSKMKPRQWPALQILYQITSQAPKEYVWCRESHTFAAAWKGISSSLLLLFWFWQCFWVSGHDPITCHGLPLLQCLPPLPPYSLKDMMIDLFYCFLHLCFIYFCSDLYDFFPSSNFGLCSFSSCFRCKVLMLFEILVSQGKIVSL